ncbi:MAG: universal stress protein [Candidatus Onthomorpha sp.]|nr:universal stress protein [Candidatus Onthomorpha sp.]MDY5920975.1 universal stress protein [Candidatus Onthomorpha sp.]
METNNQRKTPTVLVPYDFGPKAKTALQEAIKVADFIKGQIYLLSVLQASNFFTELFKSEKQQREERRHVENKLKEVILETRKTYHGNIRYIVEHGSPAEVILEQAQIRNAQYIIMGKMSSTVSAFHFIGPLTMHIIASAPCPVITVGENSIENGRFDNILLPIDLSKQTLEKINAAISWAKYYKSTVHLVGVVKRGTNLVSSRLVKKLEKAKWVIEQEGIKVTAQAYIEDERPIEEVILTHGKSVNADIMMIMTHQELSLTDNYIGAVAQNMIKKSEIPTLSFTSKAITNADNLIANFLPVDMFEVKE